jgi:hypothetical protein
MQAGHAMRVDAAKVAFDQNIGGESGVGIRHPEVFERVDCEFAQAIGWKDMGEIFPGDLFHVEAN